MQTSSRVAFVISSIVFLAAVVLAFREVAGRDSGNVAGLLVATLAGALGLALLGDWLRRYEGRR